MVGEKMEPSSLLLAVCRSWTWHLSAFVSGWGHLISLLHFSSMGLDNLVWPLICSLPCHHDLWSVDVKYCQVHCRAVVCSREVGLCKFQPSSVSHMILIHNKTLCSSVSCRWCGNHYGPPSIKVTSCRLQLIIWEADLETPFRYLGSCMPQWQFLRVRREVFIIGLRSSDSAGVRRQLIYSHAVDCTCSTLRTIVIIGGFSRVC